MEEVVGAHLALAIRLGSIGFCCCANLSTGVEEGGEAEASRSETTFRISLDGNSGPLAYRGSSRALSRIIQS